MAKKPIVSVTYENERISIKNSLPYLKCVLRLSCVVHGPIYGCFMGFYANGFLSIYLYTQGARTICLCSRLLFYSECTGFTVCFTYSDISLTMYINQ